MFMGGDGTIYSKGAAGHLTEHAIPRDIFILQKRRSMKISDFCICICVPNVLTT